MVTVLEPVQTTLNHNYFKVSACAELNTVFPVEDEQLYRECNWIGSLVVKTLFYIRMFWDVFSDIHYQHVEGFPTKKSLFDQIQGFCIRT